MHLSPTTTAANDIRHRTLNWTAEIHDAEDLSSERIHRSFGIDLVHSVDDSGSYGFANDIDARWVYTLRTLNEPELAETRRRIVFSFDEHTDKSNDFSAIYALDFGAYARTLTGAGHAIDVDNSPRAVFNAFVFAHDDVHGRVQICDECASKSRHLSASTLGVDVAGDRHG